MTRSDRAATGGCVASGLMSFRAAIALIFFLSFFVPALPSQAAWAAQGPDAKYQAIAALNAKDYDRAIKILEDASGSNPFDDGLKKLLGQAYSARGWAKVSSEKFDQALDDFKKARLAEPLKQAATYLGLGYASFRLKENDDALYYLEEAVGLDPKEDQAHALLGEIYYERGSLHEAISEWEQSLQIKQDEGVKSLLAKAKKELGVEKSFTKRETYYFNVKYEGEEERELGDQVLDILYSASTSVGGDLGYYLKEPINIILYTRQQFVDVTDAPSWSGGIFDGNIRVPMGGRVDKTALSAVLYHEFTHAVIHSMAGNRVPTWLDEGLAQYEERWVRAPEGRMEGDLIPLSKLSGSFMKDGTDTAKQAYAESLSAVQFFVDRYGMFSLSRVLNLLGEGKDISEAMNEAAGVTLPQFEGLWRESLGYQ